MTGKLKVKDGIYYAVINYKTSDGKYKQKWISTKRKERGNKKLATKFLQKQLAKFELCPNELEEQLNETHIEVTPIEKKKDIKFLDYIADYIKSKTGLVSPSTLFGYKNYFRIIKRHFGNSLLLKDVTYHHILDFFSYLKVKKNYKNSSIKRYKEILAPALKNAYRDELIDKNPFDYVPQLKREQVVREYYDANELEELFKVTDKTPLGLVVRVGAYYGLRRSELLGLRWKSIDFVKKTITIEHKVLDYNKKVYTSDVLKTLSSHRVLPLMPEIETLLLTQKEEIEKNRKLFKRKYNTKYLDYVFVDPIGNLMLPDFVTHKFGEILKKNNLKHIRFHDLRHSCASLLANKGVPMKYIQEWLGHSSYNLTANTYSHLDYSSKIESANVISRILNGENEEEKEKKELEEKEKAEYLEKQRKMEEEIAFLRYQLSCYQKQQTKTQEDDLEM